MRTTHPTPAKVGATRPWVVALAVVLLGVQLSQAAHEAWARHGVCPEHGELIELEADVDVEPSSPLDQQTLAAHVASGSADEHCALALLRRQCSGEPPLLVGAEVVAGCWAPSLATPRPTSRQSPLSVAPKQSPPA